jgi:DNA-directed RNA polymerase specialized sigma subunit
VASDTQQPTPDRNSSSSMVEAAKVRQMMERIRTQVAERDQLVEALRMNSESTLASIKEFLGDIPEL